MRFVLWAVCLLLLSVPNGAADTTESRLLIIYGSVPIAKLTPENWKETVSLLKGYPKGIYRPCGDYLITFAEPFDPYTTLLVGLSIPDKKKIGGVSTAFMIEGGYAVLPLKKGEKDAYARPFNFGEGDFIDGYFIYLPPKDYAATKLCLPQTGGEEHKKNAI